MVSASRKRWTGAKMWFSYFQLDSVINGRIKEQINDGWTDKASCRVANLRLKIDHLEILAVHEPINQSTNQSSSEQQTCTHIILVGEGFKRRFFSSKICFNVVLFPDPLAWG